MMKSEAEREALAWQTGIWDRISDIYRDEIDSRFVPVVDGVIKRASLEPGEHVLDVGTGTGTAAMRAGALVSPSGRVLGIDISAEMLRIARLRSSELAIENVSFREGSAEAIPADDAEFDLLLASLSFMYVIDRATAARERAGSAARRSFHRCGVGCSGALRHCPLPADSRQLRAAAGTRRGPRRSRGPFALPGPARRGGH